MACANLDREKCFLFCENNVTLHGVRSGAFVSAIAAVGERKWKWEINPSSNQVTPGSLLSGRDGEHQFGAHKISNDADGNAFVAVRPAAEALLLVRPAVLPMSLNGELTGPTPHARSPNMPPCWPIDE